MLRLCSCLGIPRTGFTIQLQVSIGTERGEEFSIDVVLSSQYFKIRKALDLGDICYEKISVPFGDSPPTLHFSPLSLPPGSSQAGYSNCKDVPAGGQPRSLWVTITFYIPIYFLQVARSRRASFYLFSATSLLLLATHNHAFKIYLFIKSDYKS